MYGKDISVGIKIVPVIKTIDGPLGQSKIWNEVLEDTKKKDKFLFVIRILEVAGKQTVYVCAPTKDAKAGEKFASIDLRAFPWTGWDCRKNPGKTKTAGKKVNAKVAVKKLSAKPAAKKPVAKPTAKKPAIGNVSKIAANVSKGEKTAMKNAGFPGEPVQNEIPN